MGRTLFAKIWDSHVVHQQQNEVLLYIDRHLIHEVTSPQAFAGLAAKDRKVRRTDLTFGTMDHSISTRSLAPIIFVNGPAIVEMCPLSLLVALPIGRERWLGCVMALCSVVLVG